MLRLLVIVALVCSTALSAATATQTVSFTADTTTNFPNPERGWHRNSDLINGGVSASMRNEGITITRSYIRLDAYRGSALPQSLLDQHTQRFAEVRAAGIKVIVRYAYNFGFDADAPLDRVLQHIEQLKPYWQANADVIAVLHAGFIGAWGEWHSSTNGLDSDANKRTIANALLAALPPSRMVQIRYPAAIRALFPTPVSPAEAFTGSDIARVGFKNDSFLRNYTDAGTYISLPSYDYDASLKAYAVAMSPSIVMGGETVEDVTWTEGNRQSASQALAEMAELNWDYLNRDYAQSVINPWIADGSTFGQMSRRMGYRLRLTSASMPRTATSGSVLGGVQLDVVNDGWGKVYNPRRLDLILRHTQNGALSRIGLSADARRILPLGGQTRSLQLQGQLPSLAAGTYAVLLHLAAPEASIMNRPEYSIRLANQNIWDGNTGYHDLGMTLEIQGSAPSNSAPQANAGPDQNVTLPNAAALAGSASDDGLPAGSSLSVGWSAISGPGTVSFAQAGSASTSASFSQAGTYVLQLSASDGALSAQDTVTVVVSAGVPNGAGNGLTGIYFPSRDFTGTSVVRSDATVNFDWDQAAPVSGIPADDFSVRWTGQVQAQFSETYTFITTSDDGVRLWINGQQLISNWTEHAPTDDSGSITLVAGQRYDVRMEFYERGWGAVARLSWSSPSTPRQIIPTAQLYTTAPASSSLVNGGFETPRVDGYIYNPVGAGWLFTASAAIQANSSAWSAAAAPEGQQTAVLQGAQTLGAISQTVSLAAGTYRLSFQAARRQGQIQPVRITVDGVQVGQLITPTSDAFAVQTSAAFTVGAGEHELRLAATDGSGDRSTFIDQVSLVPGSADPGTPLPAGWTTQDVGSVGFTGAASQSSGLWTVKGSGADIWNTADGFRFAGRAATGDVQVTARVTSIGNTHVWAKAGVMIRSSLTSGSAHASTFATSANGLVYQRRLTTSASSGHTAGPAVAVPAWVRLERVGNLIISSTSMDGSTWSEIRRETIALGATVYVGLAVTSHDNAQVCTATFTDVQVVGATAASN